MIQIVEPESHPHLGLDDYAADMSLVSAVSSLRAEAARVRAHLDGRAIWMINSTAVGGGVAEMLPRIQQLMRELDIDVRWAVIQTDEPRFFAVTKRIHNLIHDDASAGHQLGPDEARLMEAVNRENADSLRPHLGPRDILFVHDPQPLPLGTMLAGELGLPAVWRCHIGLDRKTEATATAWSFLQRYFDPYAHAIFSVAEYIPSFLAGRAAVVHPAIDPISHKNRHLSVSKMVGILTNGGVQQAHEPVPTPDFAAQVMRVQPDGSLAVPGELGLLFRPIVLQVSRWDRLKGWLPLLDGFVRMKREEPTPASSGMSQRNQRRLQLARLVLAGPDPSSIADDPQGLEVFQQVIARYRELEPELQRDVVVLGLPMRSRKENALIVNALQRCASLIVQNSLQEGFGLTVTEAMWKRLAVLGTCACGIREQIRDRVDGVLTTDAEDTGELAANLRTLLIEPRRRYELGRNAQLRVFSDFLVFRQIASYLRILERL